MYFYFLSMLIGEHKKELKINETTSKNFVNAAHAEVARIGEKAACEKLKRFYLSD